jgi:predicted permease
MTADIRYALRTLRRSPGFFAVAVATLALGIAANTAIFSLFYQVLLRTLPVREPERLVALHSDGPDLPGSTSSDNFETVFSYPLYLRLGQRCRAFSGLAARSSAAVQIGVEGSAERARAEVVSGNFFDVLGVRPSLGRLLSPADDSTRGGNPVAVLSFDFWTRHFGASPTALGQKILVNGISFTIAGVTPEDFRGVLSGSSPAVFVPISMKAALTPGWNGYDRPREQWLTLLGRLAPGVSRAQAETELQPLFAAVLREQVEQIGVRNERARQRLAAKRIVLRPAANGLNELERRWRSPLYALLAMVAMLLLIGCANLANLVMARAVNRVREIGIRLALGAGRLRVLRLLLVETLLVAIAGSLCGLLLAPFLTRGLLYLMPQGAIGGWLSAEISLPLVNFSALLLLAATLLCGLFPALQATRGDASSLGERTHAARIHSGSRKVLVAAQIAFSLVLLACAGLFSRSLTNLMRHNLGFRADHLLTFSIDAGLGGYNVERGVGFYHEVRRRLAALPGVTAVSLADTSPLSNSDSSSNVTVEGYVPREDEDMDCGVFRVGPGYFGVLETPMLAGREFEERDNVGAPQVAIVNLAFVRRFFGSASAVGHHMKVGGADHNMEIVGVVPDAKNISLREVAKAGFYVPYEQSMSGAARVRRAAFFLRSRNGLEALSGAVRGVVAQVDSALPVYALLPMEAKVEQSIFTDRLIAALSVAFGLLATLLTAVGLYGVISYLVGRRTAEIGIRMALGAGRSNIMWLVLREVATLALIGAVAGIAGALAAGRAIESQLFGLRGFDPLVLILAPLLLSAVALCAGALPALRAARIQPLEALRHD